METEFRHQKSIAAKLQFYLFDQKLQLQDVRRLGRMSTKSFDLSSSFFLQFAMAFDLWQQGQRGWVTLLGAGRGQGKSLGLGHKLMKVSNLDTPVN